MPPPFFHSGRRPSTLNTHLEYLRREPEASGGAPISHGLAPESSATRTTGPPPHPSLGDRQELGPGRVCNGPVLHGPPLTSLRSLHSLRSGPLRPSLVPPDPVPAALSGLFTCSNAFVKRFSNSATRARFDTEAPVSASDACLTMKFCDPAVGPPPSITDTAAPRISDSDCLSCPRTADGDVGSDAKFCPDLRMRDELPGRLVCTVGKHRARRSPSARRVVAGRQAARTQRTPCSKTWLGSFTACPDESSARASKRRGPGSGF